MIEKAWKYWNSCWEWTRQCVLKKGCEDFEIKISDPLPMESVERFEQETGLELPEDYKTTITQFAASVEFYWTLKIANSRTWTEDHPVIRQKLNKDKQTMSAEEFERHRIIIMRKQRKFGTWIEPPTQLKFSYGGTGMGAMWEYQSDPLKSYRNFQQEVRDMNEDRDEEIDYSEIEGFHRIMGLGDGDSIVMDLKSHPTRILHLDHEGSFLERNKQMEEGFEGFITRFSQLGCPAPDNGHIMKLVGQNHKILDLNKMESREWVEWFSN
jgi:hypothetical protein